MCKEKCPILEELSAIAKFERKDHIILIDDLRLITTNWVWNEKSYGNINFLQAIHELHRLKRKMRQYPIKNLSGVKSTGNLFHCLSSYLTLLMMFHP